MDIEKGEAMRSAASDLIGRTHRRRELFTNKMSITKQSKPRQTRTTGSAASHRTAGKKIKDRHNYFYDVLYGNEGARENRWERKIKVK